LVWLVVWLVVWCFRGASLALRVSVCGKLWAAGNASGERAAASHPDTTIADGRNWFRDVMPHGVRLGDFLLLLVSVSGCSL
ncbi:MAG: hypothetical protein WCK86_24240, partial [Planctomycetia bacterium]